MPEERLKVSEIIINVEKAIEDNTLAEYFSLRPADAHAFVEGKTLLMNIELAKINLVTLAISYIAGKNGKN